ncbi:DUF3891 family protein [Muricoccus aerilatus]|uniref:DUF3891 family protein n=1 Tax=Muricoccus aerilatus TaxID=452982 RepID=UPI0014701FFF|nr:DUF3891 family protein [Roseomonas aerilata]
MIFRDAPGATRLFIPQPAHALLAGQMMAAWGAPGFARPDPPTEVILAAGQHDLAWMAWEAAPTLDPGTGRPYQFTDFGAAIHAPRWAAAVEMARAAWGLWPALLISRHGTLIYTRYANPARDTAEDKAAAARYLEEQGALQRAWAAALAAPPEKVDRNAALVAVADAISLTLCFARPGPAGEAPMEDGTLAPLTLAKRGAAQWTLSPWPFREGSLTLRCEVIRLPAETRWTDEATMHRDLRTAPRMNLVETLTPG